MRGRPRTPPHLKRLRGTRADRIGGPEPAFPVGDGEPPEYLTPAGATIWRRYHDLMLTAGTFRASDADLLGLFADALTRYVEAVRTVRIEGPIVVAKNGAQGEHPALRTARNAAETVRKFGDMLGLGPVARARTRGELPPTDDLDAFLAGK